jgi:hypothetical protein
MTERGHPLGGVSTGKKVFVPNLFSLLGLSFCCWRVRSVRHYSNPSFRLINSGARTAIRSVTHLVLARAWGILFFRQRLPHLWSFLSLAAPNPLWRVQKTFSSGPCSFSLPFRGSRTAVRVQPVFDSRHGRITGKTFSRSLPRWFGGARPSPISYEGLEPTPFPGWRPRSQIYFFMVAPASCGNIRPGS